MGVDVCDTCGGLARQSRCVEVVNVGDLGVEDIERLQDDTGLVRQPISHLAIPDRGAPWEWDLKRLGTSFVGLPGQWNQRCRRERRGHHLRPDLPRVLDRYVLRDDTIKVVGIGSVGTFCQVLLFMTEEGDPLFLRLMQPASDIFLGCGEGPKRHFFIRQLRDIKISMRVDTFGRTEMDLYATWCGRALALARSGNSAMLSGYMARATP